ncbi:uncharacterized protein FFMR_09009 [Fusarium fujikuroi]|nr:uncharacterized protein FFMR_09009 [Fusarium fujikuroi]
MALLVENTNQLFDEAERYNRTLRGSLDSRDTSNIKLLDECRDQYELARQVVRLTGSHADLQNSIVESALRNVETAMTEIVRIHQRPERHLYRLTEATAQLGDATSGLQMLQPASTSVTIRNIGTNSIQVNATRVVGQPPSTPVHSTAIGNESLDGIQLNAPTYESGSSGNSSLWAARIPRPRRSDNEERSRQGKHSSHEHRSRRR